MRKMRSALLIVLTGAGCNLSHNIQRRANEDAAIATMRNIRDAEARYVVSPGKGRYGTLEDLIGDKLLAPDAVDAPRASYTFTIKVQDQKYAAQAIPVGQGPNESKALGSFYLDESQVIRVGSPSLSGSQLPIDGSDAQIRMNQERVRNTLVRLRDAEQQFEKRHGRRKYGNLHELFDEGLIPAELADGVDGGYSFQLEIGNGTFSLRAIPPYLDYSYYIDQSGIIRSATMPRVAGPDDPPVSSSPS